LLLFSYSFPQVSVYAIKRYLEVEWLIVGFSRSFLNGTLNALLVEPLDAPSWPANEADFPHSGIN
jgi:hypothetical protein